MPDEDPTIAKDPTSPKDQKAAAQKLSTLALTTLEKIMEGEGQNSVKLAAAREVLDRGYGRPKPVGGKARRSRPAQKPAGFTVVVQRFTDPTDPELEDFP